MRDTAISVHLKREKLWREITALLRYDFTWLLSGLIHVIRCILGNKYLDATCAQWVDRVYLVWLRVRPSFSQSVEACKHLYERTCFKFKDSTACSSSAGVLWSVGVMKHSHISSPCLLAAGGCQHKGGPGSWRCVQGPAQCRAAAGRSEQTGSTDRLQKRKKDFGH